MNTKGEKIAQLRNIFRKSIDTANIFDLQKLVKGIHVGKIDFYIFQSITQFCFSTSVISLMILKKCSDFMHSRVAMSIPRLV